MKNAIMRLIDGLSAIKKKDIKNPVVEIDRDEVIIGELSDPDLQRLYIFQGLLHEKMHKDIEAFKKIEVSHKTDEGHNLLNCPRCQAGLNLESENDFTSAVRSLFWASVRSSLSLEGNLKCTTAGGIAIRKGWKIVTCPQEHPLRLVGILSGVPTQF